MTTPNAANELYYSVLGNDPQLAEIVSMFVEEMPHRVREMTSYFTSSNWEQLCRVAHQLKGAAGSYGFDQITPFAARLEKAAVEKQPDAAIKAALDDLIDACLRTRAGTPGQKTQRKFVAPSRVTEPWVRASAAPTPASASAETPPSANDEAPSSANES
jgi:HPt (histidine-containing phosphotransfer) domain-containing protein